MSHEPREGSGEKSSAIEVGLFLAPGNNSPQHCALLQLIGELVDPVHMPNERQKQGNGDRRD